MAIISNPKTIELDDIQGMITRGYGKLQETAYLFLEVTKAENTKAWMQDILLLVDSAEIDHKMEKTLHLAFTARGLPAIGLDAENCAKFPVPFREGIVTENRSRILGDYGDNNPKKWRWGANSDELHMVLILHAKDKAAMTTFLKEERARIEHSDGLRIIKETTGFLPEDGKEHFGFHDGISQPVIKGSGRPGPEMDLVATGEFLMGYKNEHNQYPYTPLLEVNQGNSSLLKDDTAGSGKKNLGHNGSFMIFRTMEQHVEEFWEYMSENSKDEDGTHNEDAKIKLASKCIGRWPSGASLVNFPDKDPGGSVANDDFGYADKDPDGKRCPFGSHLRRNNPRDVFRWYNKKQSLKISKRHRIIRRGRNYKIPAATENDKSELGLQFICFNANIELQFEFIQHAWANNNQLRHLSNDIDNIIGVPPEDDPNKEKGQFTIQADPVNEFVDNWKPFVTIRGGEYFFFPSITVINYLTTI